MGLPDKDKDFSNWFSYVLKEADLIDLRYNVKGFLVIKPWAFRAIKEIYRIYEDILESTGHSPVKFPAVIPESNLKAEEEHIKGFEGEVFWITKAGFNELSERLALRPTSETAMYPMYALWVHGISDLPIKMYQSGTVWRYETKATRPFLRVREILWIEAHDVFSTEEEAKSQIDEDRRMTIEAVFERFGVPFIFLKRPQWDKFAGAVDTFAADTLMPDGKVLQIATTHFLGQNFAKPFNLKFMDTDGSEKFCWQTCYGPGISRIYAAMISTHGDSKGLIYPWNVAPVQVVIIPIYKSNNKEKEKIDAFASNVKDMFLSSNIRVVYDTSDKTPGFKFNEWELKGVPIRVEIGEREVDSNSVVLVRRDNREKVSVSVDKAVETAIDLANAMFDELKRKAKERFESSISTASSFNELKDRLKDGGLVKVPFCSIDMDGYDCYKRIKEELHAEVRGEAVGESKPHGEKCIVCGKEASVYVYVAKQY